MSQAAAAVQMDTHAEHHEELNFLHKYILPLDHKIIAMQYIFTGMIMAIIGGYLPMLSGCSLLFRENWFQDMDLSDPVNITCWLQITEPS